MIKLSLSRHTYTHAYTLCSFSLRFSISVLSVGGYLLTRVVRLHFTRKTRRFNIKTILPRFPAKEPKRRKKRTVRDYSQLGEILRILRRYFSLFLSADVHYDNDNNDGNKSATSPFCRLGNRELVQPRGREKDREIIRGDGATGQYLRQRR